MIFGKYGLVVSGHRDLAVGDGTIIHKGMSDFIGYGEFDYIMFGGARGTDTLALAAALDLRPPGSKIPFLVVVVPDTLDKQPQETWAISKQADRIIELRHRITADDRFWALKHRNEFMLDWVLPDGRLLAFWNGEASGTGHAVRYARELGGEVSVRSIKGRPRTEKKQWIPMRT